MGWGEKQGPQGDMGLGTLTPSQIITQRSEERRAGKELADAVTEWTEDPTFEKFLTMRNKTLMYYATLI